MAANANKPKYLTPRTPRASGADHPLHIMLSAAVPLLIAELRSKGGPEEADWSEARHVVKRIATEGDVLQFGGRGAGEIANMVAQSIAVLAFCPGGITFGAAHYEAEVA